MKRLSVAELIRRLQAMPQHLPVVFDPSPSGMDAFSEIGHVEELNAYVPARDKSGYEVDGRGGRRWVPEGVGLDAKAYGCPEGCVVIRGYELDERIPTAAEVFEEETDSDPP